MAKTLFHNAYLQAARERRAKALSMKLSGDTYDEIGKELGVSRQRAYVIVKQAREEAFSAVQK